MEVYKSIKGRKTYLVFPVHMSSSFALIASRKYFKCSPEHIKLVLGWTYKGSLYLEDPHKREKKSVMVAYYVR